MTARPILKISLCRPRRALTLRFRRVPISCSAVSRRIISAIGTPRPGDNTFLFSRGRWKSGSAMAPRAVLDRVMWSSLTTSQARATRRARWEFRGSVQLCRWAPNAAARTVRSHTRRRRMPERQPMTTRLKTLFQRPELFVLAGGINPIGAKMAEALGYDAFYMSGGNTSAHQLGWPDSGTSMRDMVDTAWKIVLTVQIPVFAAADTGYGDAISTHYTVREYIQAGIAGAHIEDQTFPPKSGPRRRCISIQEMVGKLRAAMDAKQALDPDFVIMARCDLGGVPGASFAEIIERCQAYKAEAQVDVICPNGLRTWEEIQEAIRLIPGPVVPLIPAHLSPYPSLEAQQDAGAAAAWFPALTTMAGLQANWDFLSDFRQRGALALDALRAQAAQSPWGVASNGRILNESRLRSMEEMYLPD